MLVFVDESGDAGLNPEKTSSPVFIVCLTIFNDSNSAQACDDEISRIRRSLQMPNTTEFRFSQNTHRVRDEFLNGVCSHDFRYSAIVLKKESLWGQKFCDEPVGDYAVKLAFQNVQDQLLDAIVVLDGDGRHRRTRNRLGTYLRQHLNSDGHQAIKKLKIQPSHRNNLIQLADMICGTLWQTYRHQDDSYRRIIARRELGVRIWPG
jgi:hypothetical protein